MASLDKTPRKTAYIGARADRPFEKKVNDYMKAGNITMADLVRNGIDEYILNHPVKPPEVSLKPGE